MKQPLKDSYANVLNGLGSKRATTLAPQYSIKGE